MAAQPPPPSSPPPGNPPPGPRRKPQKARKRRPKAKARPSPPPPPKAPKPRPPGYPRHDQPTGRPPELTPELQKRICDVIAASSLSFDDACHLAGIAPSTGRMWLQRGEGEHKNRRPEPRYVAFVEAVAQARARDKGTRVARMSQAALGGFEVARETITRPDGTKIERVRRQPPDWRADESILERRYPDEFGRRMKIEHEGGAAVVDWAGMVEEAWARIRSAAAKRVGAGKTPEALTQGSESTNGGGPPT